MSTESERDLHKSSSSAKPSVKQVKPSVKTVKSSTARPVESKVENTVQRKQKVKEAIKDSADVKETKEKPIKKETPKTNKKKSGKKILFIVLGVCLILVVAIVALLIVKKKIDERKAYEASLIVHKEQTSGYAIDRYSSCLSSFDTVALGDGTVVRNSSLANEVNIFNSSEDVEKFTKWVCSNSSLSGGNYDVRIEGAESTVDATLESIDWFAISESLDSEKISSIMTESEVSASDLDLSLELPSVFISYVMSLEEVPKITSTIPLTLVRVNEEVGDSTYYYIIADDFLIDEVLFSSDIFHSLLETFAKKVVGWTGYKMEKYTVQEEQENPEYVAWLEQLNAEIAKYPTWKNTSKCLYEPYYLRDEKGRIVKDENGNKVVNFYVLFEGDSNGKKIKDSSSPYKYKYIPEPEHTIMVDVEKERQVEDLWVEGVIFPYNWIGYSYAVENGLPIRSGDGSQINPLGENTWVLTKLTTLSGSQVDAKIELVSKYRGADAVQFALDKSEKNRGLDSSSVVELVICEFRITNLSEDTITFIPDMVLVDEYGSKLSRTGTMYGLPDEITLSSGESVIVQDWATSTDMNRYQVAWGRSFDVNTPMVYFNVIEKTTTVE